MREIKFRAWIPQYKKMIQVGNMVIPKGLNEVGDQEIGVAEVYSIINPHHYIQPVLMQYTGLKDKDGKEIYEGDIVGVSGLRKYQIVYCKEGIDRGSFVCQSLFDEGIKLPMTNSSFYIEQSQVIGNIYKNPELRVK